MRRAKVIYLKPNVPLSRASSWMSCAMRFIPNPPAMRMARAPMAPAPRQPNVLPAKSVPRSPSMLKSPRLVRS